MSLKGSAQPCLAGRGLRVLVPWLHGELCPAAVSMCLCSVLCLSTDPFASGLCNGLVTPSFKKNRSAVVYNTMLLYELHFSHCHDGEGKSQTKAKEVVSFTLLLPSFCYQKSRWVRRKKLLYLFPFESKAQPCCPARHFS